MLIIPINLTQPAGEPQVFVQDPSAVRNYGFEWAPMLLMGVETISARSFSSTPSGLTVQDLGLFIDATHARVNCAISGGVAGGTYRVTCHIQTDNGNVDERSIILKVRDT